ncbi:hypothetical protein [Synechococcus sp. CBW1107]|uniref:hypothetical protein n=1 Tax=Synechococcus sp. CBW1107 TaxID=2789857 RepID=UPI002AD3FDBA|nr:hypothetical protein [Synechococcus sp. CBW1107]CAK6697035.1 hypothetical protein IFHNHDMJ_02145 [Synechococcus sp. CBW1107]
MRSFLTPDGPPSFRNRSGKTQLGRLIDGPFLFTGIDSVLRKPLAAWLEQGAMGYEHLR